MNEAVAVLEARELVKTFSDAGRNVEVLRGVDLAVAKGDRIAIIGASGSGKTTLLQLLGGLDEPTSGEVRVVGESMSAQVRFDSTNVLNHPTPNAPSFSPNTFGVTTGKNGERSFQGQLRLTF